VLAEHGGGDGVGTGEVAGVALGHRPPGLGPPDLHAHDRDTQRRAAVGRQLQRAPVLEPLDVRRHHADLGLRREPGGEVGELEVDLVAGRGPVGQPDAEVLGLEDRPALVPRLRDERDPPALDVVAEQLEGVEVGVGPEQVGARRLHQGRQRRLQRLAVGADLGEAGGEDHRVARRLGQHRLEALDGVAGEDHGEVDLVAGHGLDRPVARQAVDGIPVRVDVVDGGALGLGP
jgi:hypothetical protein